MSQKIAKPKGSKVPKKNKPTKARNPGGKAFKNKSFKPYKASFNKNPQLSEESNERLYSMANGSTRSAYINMVLNPKNNMPVGLPDSSSAPTALYKSIRTLEVQVDFGSGASSGNFSAAVSPKLGGIASPDNYSIAFTQGADWTGKDFTSASAYENLIAGVDPRIDDNAPYLLGHKLAFWEYANTLINVNNVFSGGTVSARSYGMDIDVIDGAHLRLPIGTYRIEAVYTTIAGAGMGLIDFVGSTGITINSSSSIGSVDSTERTATAVVTVTDPNNSLYFNAHNAVGYNVATFNAAIMPIQVADVAWNPDYGNVRKIRPVAMSVLFTYNNTMLQNGGQVATALVPGDTLSSNYFTNNPINNGQFQDWDALSKVPGSYNGPISKGSYAYWRPDGSLDNMFYVPSLANVRSYPSIIVSGTFAPGATLTGLVTVGRLEIITVHEFTTSSTLFVRRYRPGSTAAYDIESRVLMGFQTSMENKIHLQAIKEFLIRAGKVLWQNRKTLMEAAQMVGPVLAAI